MMQAAWPEAPDSLQTDLDGEQEKELSALTELIRQDRQMLRLLLSMTPTDRQLNCSAEAFRQLSPAVMDRIDSLSARYKLNTEDIRFLSDTPAYLKLFQDRLKSRNSGVSVPWLAGYCHDRLHINGSPCSILRTIREADLDLYLILCGLGVGSTARNGSGHKLAGLKQALELLRNTVERHRQDMDAVRLALAGYPTLRQTLAVAQSEALFRSNFHHLITRYQRKIAALLLDAKNSIPAEQLAERGIFDLDIGSLTRAFREQSDSYGNRRSGNQRSQHPEMEALAATTRIPARVSYAEARVAGCEGV
jgi:hypothetical protein